MTTLTPHLPVIRKAQQRHNLDIITMASHSRRSKAYTGAYDMDAKHASDEEEEADEDKTGSAYESYNEDENLGNYVSSIVPNKEKKTRKKSNNRKKTQVASGTKRKALGSFNDCNAVAPGDDKTGKVATAQTSSMTKSKKSKRKDLGSSKGVEASIAPGDGKVPSKT